MAEQRTRILIIDDDPSIRELVALHLRNAEYEVLQAEDAIEGGHLVVKARPDLMIVDVQMPYMNGYDFVRAVKADPETRTIPIVFLTIDEAVVTEAAQVGAAYLRKPVRVDELLRIVGQLAPP